MRGDLTINGGMLTLVVILMMMPGSFLPIDGPARVPLNTTPSRFQCEGCGEKFVSMEGFLTHFRNCHFKRKIELP